MIYLCSPFVSHAILIMVIYDSLIERELTATSVIKNSVRMHTSGAFDKSQHSPELLQIVHNAANKSLASLRSNVLPQYKPGMSSEKCSNQLTSGGILTKEKDCNYSFRASFSGFVLSLIDNVPSEIAVIALRKLDAMAEWNASRTKESTGAVSIGWMQIDNHCPNAPYPVALCPAKKRDDVDDDGNEIQRPFVTIGFVRAPHHTSDVTVSASFSSNLLLLSYNISPYHLLPMTVFQWRDNSCLGHIISQ